MAAIAVLLPCWAVQAGTIAPNIQIGREATPSGALGCRERAWIRNTSSSEPVRVRLLKIQHLFSGTHSQELVIDLQPGQRSMLGCTSWPGAMAKTEFRVLAAVHIPLPPMPINPSQPPGEGHEECVAEGGFFPITADSLACCSGLVDVGCGVPDSWGECLPCLGASYCTRCGDGFCGVGENACRCPGDCGENGCRAPSAYRVVTIEQLHRIGTAGAVAVVAAVDAAPPRCGERSCPPDDACCNRCDGGYLLARASGAGAVAVVSGDVDLAGCSGDNCEYPSECSPLAVGTRYLLWGHWHPEGGGGRLELDGFCAPRR